MAHDSFDDDWDSLVRLEEEAIDTGYAKGELATRIKALHEGISLGYAHGFKLGLELGFYQEFCQAVLSQTAEGQSERARKCVISLQELARDFPRENVKDQPLVEMMGRMRAKHKLALSLLHRGQRYDAGSDMSF